MSAKLIINAFALRGVDVLEYKAGIDAVSASQKPATPQQLQIPQGNGKDVPLYSSPLGTPVMSNLEIAAGSYTKNGVVFNYNEIRIDVVLFTVSRQNNIIKTDIQGRDGSIKEYISSKDFEINIRLILQGGNSRFPKADSVNLITALNSNQALVVSSWYLVDLFSIHNIVIENYSAGQIAGGYSQQAFNITACSDLPVELKIRQ